MGQKEKDNLSAVVKVDSFLLSKVEQFIGKSENKFKFANKKQFVNLAIHKYLEELKKSKINEKK